MPTLSASDYTQYLKFKAAAASPIQQSIQSRTNATTSQSVLNAQILASQAALVVNPSYTVVVGNARIRPVQPLSTNNPNALSTVSYAGTSGTLSSSRTQQSGGLPNKGAGTYSRIPQNAGWSSASPGVN
jgi:hypothetical protein